MPTPRPALSHRKIVYLVTEDWAFYRHRLPMARAARDAGFEVHVITRIVERRGEIEREGFIAHNLDWQRGSLSLTSNLVAVAKIRGLLKNIAPSVLHNVALKPAILGSLAAEGLRGLPVINSINGLGSAFLGGTLKAKTLQAGLKITLRALLNRANRRTIVQNPEDFATLRAIGIPFARLVIVPGSGVDTDSLQPLPDPPRPLRMAYVGRMLDDKGVRPLVEAHRILRKRGLDIELLLAGEPDPENPTSITKAELDTWSRESGVTWAGHVEQISDVWAQSHIAVLLSRREGLPKSLLEAAAFGRAMIATDVPGCREIAIEGETGLLVPVDNASAAADAIARLAADDAMRLAFGRNARALVEHRLSAREIGRQTAAIYLELLN